MSDPANDADFQQALRIIDENPGRGDFLGGRDEPLIAEAARALGVEFPPSYRRFLQQLGAGSFGGREFYGVIDRERMAMPGPPNAVGSTLADRDDYDNPPELIVIGSTGFGPDYVLDTAQRDERAESPVLVWYRGESAREDAERDAGSFAEHFARRIKAAVDTTGG
jgi:hypothetical protein